MDEEACYAALKALKLEKKGGGDANKKKERRREAQQRAQLSEEEKREKIRADLQRKRECEARALSIVYRLSAAFEECGDVVCQEWLFQAASFIAPCHYDDAVDERVCSGVCGLPTCGVSTKVEKNSQKVLPKYKIDTRLNKIFDVTERRKFCSDLCFKKSKHFRSQLSSSPLWMREPKDVIKVEPFVDDDRYYWLCTVSNLWFCVQ